MPERTVQLQRTKKPINRFVLAVITVAIHFVLFCVLIFFFSLRSDFLVSEELLKPPIRAHTSIPQAMKMAIYFILRYFCFSLRAYVTFTLFYSQNCTAETMQRIKWKAKVKLAARMETRPRLAEILPRK